MVKDDEKGGGKKRRKRIMKMKSGNLKIYVTLRLLYEEYHLLILLCVPEPFIY